MDLGIPGIGEATEIGVGASAQVFRARQLKIDRDVAVKVLSTTDADFVRRFNREARTLGRLSRHEGIVTLYEYGETASGQPFLILELCEESLLDRVRREGRLDPFEACGIVGEVATTVAAAHEADVVHRDLKPANILLGHGGRHLITDFGISTVLGSTSGHTASVGFTAGYAAPETFAGARTSGKEADIYALGATLFHLLSGQPPFADPDGDGNLLALIRRIAEEAVPDLRADGIPDQVCSLVEQMMEKEPGRRPDAATAAIQLGGLVPTAETPAVPANPTRSITGDVGAGASGVAVEVDPHPAPATSDLTAPTSASGVLDGGLGMAAALVSDMGDAELDPATSSESQPSSPGSWPEGRPDTGAETGHEAAAATGATVDPSAIAAGGAAGGHALAAGADGRHEAAAATGATVDPSAIAAAGAEGGAAGGHALAGGAGAAGGHEAPARTAGVGGPEAAGPPGAVAGHGAGGGGGRLGVGDGRDRVAGPVSRGHREPAGGARRWGGYAGSGRRWSPTLLLSAIALVGLLAAAAWVVLRDDGDRGTAASATGSGAEDEAAGDGDSGTASADGGQDNGGPADEDPAAPATVDAATEGDGQGTGGDPATAATDGGPATTERGTASSASTASTVRSTTSISTTGTPSTSATTGTTAAPTLDITSINGPSTVTCWDGNQTYTAITNGVAVTSWNWNTGGLGLQSPFNSGPGAILSFDLDPGTYSITVTANGSVSQSKQITVVAGPGCTEAAPNPVISGPAAVDCNTTHSYSVSASNGVPLTSFAWSAAGPQIQSSSSGQSATIGFAVDPGPHQVTVTVNGEFSTTRTITVIDTGTGCG